ncbi:MAG: shikimate dehydrogenase, partial [Bacteroidetes bacterium]|nr:shikimate dehydrogenase [Bacteroidota bacterium]
MFRQFGLIGKKLGHSFSKKYFTEKFNQEGVDAAYELYEIPEIEELKQILKIENLRGLNVTIPYKAEVIPYLDWLSPDAEAIQAVNTILLNDGEISGHNSDVYGFRISLEKFLNGTVIEHTLILGTGGAARAVAYVLDQADYIHRYTFVSRNPEDGTQLSYEDLNKSIIASTKLIINTTPLGMYPEIDHAPALPYEYLDHTHFLYDLVYNPAETLFLKKGNAQGAQI